MQIVLENTKSFLKWAFVFQVWCNFFQQCIFSLLLKYLLILKTEDKPSKLISWSHFLCLTPHGLLHLNHGFALVLARPAGPVCCAKRLLHHRNPGNKELQTSVAPPSSKGYPIPWVRECVDAHLREAAGAMQHLAHSCLLRDSKSCRPLLRPLGIMTQAHGSNCSRRPGRFWLQIQLLQYLGK